MVALLAANDTLDVAAASIIAEIAKLNLIAVRHLKFVRLKSNFIILRLYLARHAPMKCG